MTTQGGTLGKKAEIHKRQWQEDKQVEIANGADLSGETYGNNNVVVETCVQNIQSYG